MEAAAVDDAGDDFAHIEALFDVVGNDPVQLVRIVNRIFRRGLFDERLLRTFELRDDVAADGDTLVFVVGRIIDRARLLRVQIAAADFVSGHDLTRGGFHERRTAQEHAAGAARDDAVVAHARDVRATRRALTQHQRHLLHAHLGQDRLVTENAAREILVREHVGLKLQLATGRIAQVDHRQTVLNRDIQCADHLVNGHGIPSAALHGGIVGVNDDFTARDDADARDVRSARRFTVVELVGGQRRQLEERRARIEQLLQTFARRHLALLGETVEVALRALEAGVVLLLTQFGGEALVVGVTLTEIFRTRIDE